MCLVLYSWNSIARSLGDHFYKSELPEVRIKFALRAILACKNSSYNNNMNLKWQRNETSCQLVCSSDQVFKLSVLELSRFYCMSFQGDILAGTSLLSLAYFVNFSSEKVNMSFIYLPSQKSVQRQVGASIQRGISGSCGPSATGSRGGRRPVHGLWGGEPGQSGRGNQFAVPGTACHQERYCSFHISLSKAFWQFLFYYFLFLAETFMMRVNVFYTTRNKISA